MAPKMCLQVAYFKEINGLVAWVVALLDTIPGGGESAYERGGDARRKF